jgi:ankyrin repeat protein
VEQLYAAWIEQSMTGRLPLLIRLRQTARHQYSVAHDRNFAILSLVNEEEVKKIKPDYRQPYSSLRSTVGVLLQRSVGWNADRDKYLLANPKDFRTINEEFCQASHNGDCPTILHFMVSETMMDTQRGLRAAALRGHLDVVRLLLEHGARIHADRSSDHDTALFGACTNGHVAIVKLLIERGALADVPGSRLSTALSAALANDHIDVAKLLLEHGVDADGTELNVASARGRIDLAELLLNNGADVNAYGNGYGTEGFTNGTALHVASARGFYDLAGLLLERGANANANIRVSAPGYERGLTPLWHAASNGDIATMRLLHARGGVLPDSYGPNDDGKYTTSAQGRMLLLKKAARNNQASVLELLLTEEGIEEPLAVALKYGSTSVVELLLTKLGIDGNMLQYAAGNDRSERPCRRHRAPTELKGHRYRYLGIQPYHLAVVESTNLHKISTEERGVDRKAVEASMSLGVSRSMGVASSMAIKTSDTAEAELGPILLTENRHGKPIIARTPPGVVTVNEILL